MTLHIFNPEHDIALASGLENFTAPHAGRQLRHDLGWLPALWAKEGDVILVDNDEQARKGTTRLKRLKHLAKQTVQFKPQTAQFEPLTVQFDFRFVQTLRNDSLKPDDIEPWGWNAALRAQLIRKGVNPELLPTPQQTDIIRQLSHRRTSALLLRQLHEALPHHNLTGEATECTQTEDVKTWLAQWHRIVVKAPWSSSGRGVRFVSGELTDSVAGWLRNTLSNQGSVMVEPYYNKVKDFGMEFIADGKGHVSYLGLSLFHTQNGAYTGNLLATEAHKLEVLSRYLPAELLGDVQQAICQLLSDTIGKQYAGPFGIDMMIVNTSPTSRFSLHPCVEINLRRTMGHVALALTHIVNPQNDDEVVRIMRIVYEDNQYKLKCTAAPILNKNTGKKAVKHTF